MITERNKNREKSRICKWRNGFDNECVTARGGGSFFAGERQARLTGVAIRAGHVSTGWRIRAGRGERQGSSFPAVAQQALCAGPPKRDGIDAKCYGWLVFIPLTAVWDCPAIFFAGPCNIL